MVALDRLELGQIAAGGGFARLQLEDFFQLGAALIPLRCGKINRGRQLGWIDLVRVTALQRPGAIERLLEFAVAEGGKCRHELAGINIARCRGLFACLADSLVERFASHQFGNQQHVLSRLGVRFEHGEFFGVFQAFCGVPFAEGYSSHHAKCL